MILSISKRNVPNKKGEHLYNIPHWHIDLLSHFQIKVPLVVINDLTYGFDSKPLGVAALVGLIGTVAINIGMS